MSLKNRFEFLSHSRSEIFAIAIVVLITRWSTLSQPLVERHDFRQTQTAFTTLTMANGDGGLFSSKLPLFGSPWELPLEFPLFQFIASLNHRLFNLEIDFANRFTSLIFFCLCLFPLQTIASRYMTRLGSLLTCLSFAFSPLAIQWSRASLIEYCVVFFGLLFVSHFLQFWDKPSWKLAIVATVTGSITGLIKVTTLLPMVVFVVAVLISRRDVLEIFSKNRVRNFGAAGIMLVSFLTTQTWVKFSDGIRASNPATLWLTQSRLNEWNFGTIEQRQSLANWKILFERIDNLIFLPSTIIFFVLIGSVFSRSRRVVMASSLSVITTISIFFNLYVVHDYYLIAVSCMIALVVGSTIDASWSMVKNVKLKTTGWILIPVLMVSYSIISGKSYWITAYNDYPRIDSELALLSNSEQQAFVSWDGWNPLILYYANRKGMMLDPRSASIEYLKSLKDLNRYDFYAGKPDRPDVMQIRGLYSPVGVSTTRIDDDIDDFRQYGLVFSTDYFLTTRPLRSTASINCDGATVFDLRKIPIGTVIRTEIQGTPREFGVSMNLQTVPIGKSIKILSALPEKNTGRLVCGGGGYVHFKW
jgi:hypothetical protein